MGILYKQIRDERLFNIPNQGFRVRSWFGPSERGRNTPQSNLFPLLRNIYLHKPDMEVGRLQKELSTGRKSRRTKPDYSKVRRLGRKVIKGLGNDPEVMECKNWRRLRLVRKLRITHRSFRAPKFVKVKYARYADDFITGVAGSPGDSQ